VSFVITVGKVEASDIHAGVHELAEAFFAPTSRSQGTNNLGASLLGFGGLLDDAERDDLAV
jgi:hypothetical protein